ncbi:PQQ-binding-like beta-propeller repeat protein [Streptomyces sp. ISL-43]|nr:PQQ-binding-like beta-propeller repeat protein [Streptomyces sp. ISL-43]
MIDGVVYLGGERGLYALDAATGQQWWRFSTGGEWGEGSGPAVADGTVYVGSGSSQYAVDAHSGQQRWAFHTGH